nr:hypothetical protein [Xanthomonas vasicola]
ANILISTCSSTVSMALQKGQRLREVGQFEVAEVGQIKSAGDTVESVARHHYPEAGNTKSIDSA